MLGEGEGLLQEDTAQKPAVCILCLPQWEGGWEPLAGNAEATLKSL